MNRRMWALAAAVVVSFVGAEAKAVIVAGDAMNTLAPGLAAQSTWMVLSARKSDGSIWTRTISSALGPWTSYGSPPGGAASGPAATMLGGSTLYQVVRSANGNIYAKSFGGSWVSYGAPPSGAGSAPNVASLGTAPGATLHVVVLGNDNVPYMRTRNVDGSLGAWTKIGVNSALGVPAISIGSTAATNIFSLGGFFETIQTRCVFMSCFTSWSAYGGPGVGASGSSAIFYWATTGHATMKVAVLGTDMRPWIATSTNDGVNFGSFVSLGGPAADSSPAIAHYVTSGHTVTAVHRPDGNYWVHNSPPGAWTSYGHP